MRSSTLALATLAALTPSAVALAALAPCARAGSPPAPAALVGPPALCHPVVIGDAKSLPWDGQGGFTVARSYDAAQTVPDTLAILAESDDTLVHMETLRRAAIYVSGMGRAPGERADRETREARALDLRDALARRVELARAADALRDEVDGAGAKRELGLRLFDLGYVLGSLSQAGIELDDRGAGSLREALELLPEDGAAHLGYALASWDREPRSVRCAHLDKALARVEDREGRLGRSLLSTAAPVMGCDTFDELAAEVRRGLGRG